MSVLGFRSSASRCVRVAKNRGGGRGYMATESEALKIAFYYLVNSININSLLPAALSKGLIDDRLRTECESEPDAYKKSEKFLGQLQRTVNGDASRFHTFVEILEDTSQSNIASRLRG